MSIIEGRCGGDGGVREASSVLYFNSAELESAEIIWVDHYLGYSHLLGLAQMTSASANVTLTTLVPLPFTSKVFILIGRMTPASPICSLE